MQACSHNVRLSTHVKGRPRKYPVWEIRYRFTNGKDSTRTLGNAWIDLELWAKKERVRHLQSRPKDGFMTRGHAETEAQRWMEEHADVVPEGRRTFRRACDDFLRCCEREKGTRGTTLHEYRRIAQKLCARPWRGELTWGERPLDTFQDHDLGAAREEMIDRGLSAQTINQYRRVLRGALGEDHQLAKAWKWMAVRSHQSDGKIHFYDPDQVAALKARAKTDEERALYTLATQAGPRISEILALKVGNVDFETGRIRIEDGYTVRGGHAGTKGHQVRSVPMTDEIRIELGPLCQSRLRHELVFNDPLAPEKPLGYDYVYRRFKRTAKRAGLPPLRFHELRHSFGTVAVKFVDIHALQRLMGHQDIKTTMRYLHYKPDPDLGAQLSQAWAPSQNVIPLRAAS